MEYDEWNDDIWLSSCSDLMTGGSQRVGFLTRGLMVVWVVKERAAQLKKL